MNNVTIFEVESFGVLTEHVTIDKGNNEFETMTKVEYDRRQAAQVEHLTGPTEL